MKKKGFTLVELLAVIAILAVLVIIALPNVLKLFRNAKQNTFVTEVQNIVRSAETKYVTGSILSGKNTCFDSSTNLLDISGRNNLIYKVRLTNNGKVVEVYVRDEEYEIIAKKEAGIKKDEIGKTYKVESAKTEITDCKGNVLISGEKPKIKYVESTLNGADPVLGSGMIPVMLSDTGIVTYAHNYDEWYNYANKEWANAVILVDTPSKKYTEGDTIAESDIRAYFVWIPKYSYRIFNIGNYTSTQTTEPESQVKEIEIEFGTRTTTNDEVKKECASPMESGTKGDCDIGDLMTHPAFLSIPSNGFWVGKFETGYNQNSDVTKSIAETDIANWTTTKAQIAQEYQIGFENKIIVKPDVYSWRSSSVYTYFMSAYNFNRTLDSHMMKNTEWGAVAYLSQTKYGIKGEVRINNNSNYLTGYAANENDISFDNKNNSKWNTTTGYNASTTGNITGIYDMSGGAYEFVASYLDNYGVKNSENIESGFKENDLNTYSKYIDKYTSDSAITSYKKRILGDAIGEMGPFWNNNGHIQSTWYLDSIGVVNSKSPWYVRSRIQNDNISNSGIFTAALSNGSKNHTGTGFRLILTPTN